MSFESKAMSTDPMGQVAEKDVGKFASKTNDVCIWHEGKFAAAHNMFRY
jgi:hypothetical protein